MSTVPKEEMLPSVRRQLEEGQRFWRICWELAEVSDELSRRRLKGGDVGAEAANKKGASRISLTRK